MNRTNGRAYAWVRPWPLCGGRLRSLQLLRHIRHWTSRKPLEIEAWFQRTINRKWHIENRKVTWLMTSGNPERSSDGPNTLKAQYLEKAEGAI